MPEVFLLCEYATLNGGERSMLATLDGIRVAGFTPVVMAPSQGPLADAIIARSVELLPFECRTAEGTRRPQGHLREELAQLLRHRRPALLHANSLAMGRLSGPVTADLGIPSLSHLRDIINLSRQAIVDLNCHTRLLAVSHATREFHVAAGLAAEKVFVVYNGVDLDEFCLRTPTGYLHQELGLPPETPLIGTIGQIGLRKGHDVLLQAATAVAGRLPNVHYLIIGERHSEKDESRQFEQDLHEVSRGPLGGRVHFLGFRTDVARLLDELTLLVHPARQEPLGRVLLEAAATGLAAIAADVGGTSEIFPPNQDVARLVPPDDAAALAEAIMELVGDAELRHRLGLAARRRAEDRFNIRDSVNELLQHYELLVGRNRRDGPE
jgi:glycosyltransferase involved in cell wall biosynthesis